MTTGFEPARALHTRLAVSPPKPLGHVILVVPFETRGPALVPIQGGAGPLDSSIRFEPETLWLTAARSDQLS